MSTSFNASVPFDTPTLTFDGIGTGALQDMVLAFDALALKWAAGPVGAKWVFDGLTRKWTP